MLLILIPIAVYSLVIVGLILLLHRLGVANRWKVLLGFLIFGVATGIGAALVWPLDSCALVNLFAVLFGDWTYTAAIRFLGDPASAQAHYTIPWILRVPQVYVPAAVVLYGLMGAIAQWAWNRK